MFIAIRHRRPIVFWMVLGISLGQAGVASADLYPLSRTSAFRSWLLPPEEPQDPSLLASPGDGLTVAAYTSSAFPSARFNTNALAIGHGMLVTPELAFHLRGGLQYELGLAGSLLRLGDWSLSWDATAVADNYLLARPGTGTFSLLALPPQVGWGGDVRLGVATVLDGWVTAISPVFGWRSNRTVLGLEGHLQRTWAPLTWHVDAGYIYHPSLVVLNDPTWSIASQELTLGTAVQVALLPRLGLNLAYQNQPFNAYGLSNQSFTAGLSFLSGALRDKQSPTLLGNLIETLSRLWSTGDETDPVTEVPPSPAPDRTSPTPEPQSSGAEASLPGGTPSPGPQPMASPESVTGAVPSPGDGAGPSPVPSSGVSMPVEGLPVPPNEEAGIPDAPLSGRVELSLATRLTGQVSLLQADPEGRFSVVQQNRLEGTDRLNFENLPPGRYRLKIEESTGDSSLIPMLTLAAWDQVGGEVHRETADLRWDGAGFSEVAYPGGARFAWPAPTLKGAWTYQVLTYRSDARKGSVALGRYPSGGTTELEVDTRMPGSSAGAVWGVVRFWKTGDRFGGAEVHGQSRPFRVWMLPAVSE